MKKKIRKIIILSVVMTVTSVLFSACAKNEETVDIEAQKTSFAQTAEAQAAMTQAAQPTATPTLEPSLQPTATETDAVNVTVATATDTTGAEATVTPTATTQAAVTTGSDAATWRAQDPEDYTEFAAGESFTVTWTIENTGTSTWTTDYSIMFASGDQMGASEQIYLPYAVSPGTNVQITVDFVAPSTAGEYQSYWSLLNASENVFYTNFYIIIDVVSD